LPYRSSQALVRNIVRCLLLHHHHYYYYCYYYYYYYYYYYSPVAIQVLTVFCQEHGEVL